VTRPLPAAPDAAAWASSAPATGHKASRGKRSTTSTVGRASSAVEPVPARNAGPLRPSARRRSRGVAGARREIRHVITLVPRMGSRDMRAVLR